MLGLTPDRIRLEITSICAVRVAMWFASTVGIFVARAASCSAEPEEADQRATVSVLAEGYLANRRAFEFATCRYEVTYGSAQSPKDALAGKVVVRDKLLGTWVFDGQRERCSLVNEKDRGDREKVDEQRSRPAVAAPPEGPGMATATAMPSTQFIDDGNIQVSYSPEIRVANVSTADNRQANSGITPWNMGVMGAGESMSPGKLILEFVQNRKDVALVGDEMLNGVRALTVKLTDAEKRTVRISLDTARGFLPIHMDFSGDFELFITDVRQCSGGRYFPMRSCELTPNKKTGQVTVREVRVVSLDVDKRPDADEFGITLDAGTRVINLARKNDRFVLNQSDFVSIANLADLTRSRGRLPQDMEPPDEGQRRGSSRLYLFAAANGVVILIIAVIVGRRCFRSRRKVSDTHAGANQE